MDHSTASDEGTNGVREATAAPANPDGDADWERHEFEEPNQGSSNEGKDDLSHNAWASPKG